MNRQSSSSGTPHHIHEPWLCTRMREQITIIHTICPVHAGRTPMRFISVLLCFSFAHGWSMATIRPTTSQAARPRAVRMGEAEDRAALRLPEKEPGGDVIWRDDTGDPLGGGGTDEEMLSQAMFRVRRRAAAGEFSKEPTSRSLPLVALLAQVGLGSVLCVGFGYCWLVRSEADAGTAWAVDALAASSTWFPHFPPRPLPALFDRPPGGPITLFYAAANGLNAVRCAPLLFDRLLVARLPNSGQTGEKDVDE